MAGEAYAYHMNHPSVRLVHTEAYLVHTEVHTEIQIEIQTEIRIEVLTEVYLVYARCPQGVLRADPVCLSGCSPQSRPRVLMGV